jgi:hypothetical protein
VFFISSESVHAWVHGRRGIGARQRVAINMENKKIGFLQQRARRCFFIGWFLFSTYFSRTMPVYFDKVYKG